MFKHQLGAKVQDRITGVQGVIVGRTQWLYGCIRYSVQPLELKDSRPVDQVGFDEDQLVVIEEPTPQILGDVADEVAEVTGGPKPDATRRAEPKR